MKFGEKNFGSEQNPRDFCRPAAVCNNGGCLAAGAEVVGVGAWGREGSARSAKAERELNPKGGTLPVGVMADKKAGHRELRLRVVVTNMTGALADWPWPGREEVEIVSCSSSSGLL